MVNMCVAVSVVLFVELLTVSAAVARYRLCALAGAKVECTTACAPITATFDTYEQCEAAKKTVRFPKAGNQHNTGKPAGAAGLAECRRRYGKSVTHAALSKNNTLICHQHAPQSDDPNVMRDVCKKRFGPMSQIRRHRGKWYCTA